MRPTIKLRHTHRGSWFAEADDPGARALIGEGVVPVLRDWEDRGGGFHWTESPPRYAEDGSGPDGRWWASAAHVAWRAALVDGALVWVRKAAGANGVGRSVGLWRIGAIGIDEHAFSLSLVERVAEVR